MKLSRKRRTPQIALNQECYSLSTAKTFLGRLIEKASKGERVFIIRGQRRFLLQEIPPIDPIPVRPPGYFSHCYTMEEIKEDNALAKKSVIKPPQDLE